MPSDKDIVQEAREFIGRIGNCGLYPDKAQRIISALADEVERLRERDGLLEADDIRACDKCDLCEDHHANF